MTKNARTMLRMLHATRTSKKKAACSLQTEKKEQEWMIERDVEHAGKAKQADTENAPNAAYTYTPNWVREVGAAALNKVAL